MLLNPIQAGKVLAAALQHRFAILAVNADSPAAITDVLEAALQMEAPVMIETSLWQLTGRSFGAGDATLGLARYLAQTALLADSDRFQGIPVFFHTDHIKGPVTLPLLKQAIQGLGCIRGADLLSPSSISLDSSSMTEEQNIASALELCRTSLECGRPLTLEIEAGVDDGLTPLDVAERLIAGVESRAPGFIQLWAPGVGTQHGLGDQSSFSPETVQLHQELASRLTGRPVGIALHGSSGVPEDGLRRAVAAGVTKVNWSSESLLIRSKAAQEYYASHSAQLEKSHTDWKNTAMDNGVQSFVSKLYVPKVCQRMQVLGGAKKAALCLKAALS